MEAKNIDQIKQRALALNINLRYEQNKVLLSIDETVTPTELVRIASIFKVDLHGKINTNELGLDPTSLRTSAYLEYPAFLQNQSESAMMRYLKQLENRDYSLVHGMIPLGSCTMKLNAATELIPLTWKAFSDVHPFVPKNQVEGYYTLIERLQYYLNLLTGFDHTSFQPNAGAQGEYAGLLVIKAYHAYNNQHQRNIVLIPASAHGTNPASAAMAGLLIVSVKCNSDGDIDLNDLALKAQQYSTQLCALMITYPSTHGVFEEGVERACEIIHKRGGQVYMDGANMNAMMGLIQPAKIGVDICHLNLHKTFCIPHGGGGPGMGPICMAKHLTPFAPSSINDNKLSKTAIGAISSAAFGSASILLISYSYIRLCGLKGLKRCSESAILHANYIRQRLQNTYDILFTGKDGFVAHELIIDCSVFSDISAEDIAKRLIDYSFHPPTMSWPVNESLMIEPTESETKAEIDRFCEALLSIYQEIVDSKGKKESILSNAPHTLNMLLAEDWQYDYTRTEAAYPLDYLINQKFWPAVARVNNVYGDKHLVCSCVL